jgi:hypothetical protein
VCPKSSKLFEWTMDIHSALDGVVVQQSIVKDMCPSQSSGGACNFMLTLWPESAFGNVEDMNRSGGVQEDLAHYYASC